MIARKTRPLSLAEFLRLPETRPYTELIDGVMEQKPVGKIRHALAQSRLLQFLMGHPATAAGMHMPELGVRFPGTSLGNLRVPDIAFYLDAGKLDPAEDYPVEPPDLAVEVRSEGQTMRSQRDRLTFLREQGTICTLLIDPETKTVEVHDGDNSWTANSASEVQLSELGGFSFRVADLFE